MYEINDNVLIKNKKTMKQIIINLNDEQAKFLAGTIATYKAIYGINQDNADEKKSLYEFVTEQYSKMLSILSSDKAAVNVDLSQFGSDCTIGMIADFISEFACKLFHLHPGSDVIK